MREILHPGVTGVARTLGLLVCGLCMVSCPDRGPTLDEAIGEFLDARYQSNLAICSCYQLFIYIAIPEPISYESEEHCLAVNGENEPAAEHVECVKSALARLPQDEQENIELLQCYAAAARDYMQCYLDEVEGTCASSAQQACSQRRSTAHDACDGYHLTSEQTGQIFYCTADP